MDYTSLSLAEVKAALDGIANEAHASFGSLGAQQLNWRPDATRWSVAQCFEHLVTANRLMLRAAEEAMNDTAPPSVWRRIPLLPGAFGRLMVRSQSPDSTRKYTASPKATPATSDIASDIIRRFIEQHRDAAMWVERLAEDAATRTVMTSPFLKIITYSVLDGCRLIVAHDRRHFEQARRVTLSPGFPMHQRSA